MLAITRCTEDRSKMDLIAGVNKKQENSFFFPNQKFCSPCISRSNFAPTPLIFQFLLVFKQQLFEVTKKHRKKQKKCAKNDHFYLILPWFNQFLVFFPHPLGRANLFFIYPCRITKCLRVLKIIHFSRRNWKNKYENKLKIRKYL